MKNLFERRATVYRLLRKTIVCTEIEYRSCIVIIGQTGVQFFFITVRKRLKTLEDPPSDVPLVRKSGETPQVCDVSAVVRSVSVILFAPKFVYRCRRCVKVFDRIGQQKLLDIVSTERRLCVDRQNDQNFTT